jgi:hypothetical protein
MSKIEKTNKAKIHIARSENSNQMDFLKHQVKENTLTPMDQMGKIAK